MTFKLSYNAPDLLAGDYPWPKAAPLCPRIKLALAIQNLVGPVDLAATDTEKKMVHRTPTSTECACSSTRTRSQPALPRPR